MDNLLEFFADPQPISQIVPPSTVPENIRNWWVAAEFNADWPAGQIEADIAVRKVLAKFPASATIKHYNEGTAVLLIEPAIAILRYVEELIDQMEQDDDSLDRQERNLRMIPLIDGHWRDLDLIRRVQLFEEADLPTRSLLSKECPAELRDLVDDQLNANW